MKLECYFTRELLLTWVIVEEPDYEFIDDDLLIHKAAQYLYINGVDKNTYYIFDNGNIIEQKKLTEFMKNEKN